MKIMLITLWSKGTHPVKQVLTFLLTLLFIVTFPSCIETYIENPTGEEEDSDEVIIDAGDLTNSYSEALAGNCVTHELDSDYSWTASSIIKISLNGNSATIEGKGASAEGGTITISEAGNYRINGSLSEGQVVVDAPDSAIVRLILDNVSIACSAGSPVWVANAGKTIIVLAENSSNLLTEKSSAADSVKAALLSTCNLTLCGPGKLSITANSNDGISVNDGLIISSVTLEVTAADNGIRGKDYLVVKSGKLSINAGGDGLKSDHDADYTKGYIAVLAGSIDIVSSGDAFDARTDALIVDGNVTVKTNQNEDGTGSSKGLKGLVNVIIGNGDINLNCADNAVHSLGNIAINGGKLTASTSLKNAHGLNSKNLLTISGGNVAIEVCGDESKAIKATGSINLNGGVIDIKTSGGVVLSESGSGFDPSYCAAVKSGDQVIIDGSALAITSSGVAGKGISTEGDFTISSGVLNISTTGNGASYKDSTGSANSYSSACISCKGAVKISGGTLSLSSTGSAGKGIVSSGAILIGNENSSPFLSITTTGSSILVSGTATSGTSRPGGMGSSNADYSLAKAIKSDSDITIDNGTLSISSADDGIKSEKSITINGGTVSVSKSTEAMESPKITVNNGEVHLVASDDGFNATAGLTAGGTEQNDGSSLVINGGVVTVNTSGGDGIDSNGTFTMKGGTVVVQGPQSQPELGMDVNGTIDVSGGLLIVSGPNSGNMIEAPGTSSSQYSVKVTSTSIGTNFFHVEDAGGKEIVTFKPVRNAYYIVFSTPGLKNGSSYSLYTGGSSTGTSLGGYYSGGSYSGGTLKKTFTISGKVSSVSF